MGFQEGQARLSRAMVIVSYEATFSSQSVCVCACVHVCECESDFVNLRRDSDTRRRFCVHVELPGLPCLQQQHLVAEKWAFL